MFQTGEYYLPKAQRAWIQWSTSPTKTGSIVWARPGMDEGGRGGQAPTMDGGFLSNAVKPKEKNILRATRTNFEITSLGRRSKTRSFMFLIH